MEIEDLQGNGLIQFNGRESLGVQRIQDLYDHSLGASMVERKIFCVFHQTHQRTRHGYYITFFASSLSASTELGELWRLPRSSPQLEALVSAS